MEQCLLSFVNLINCRAFKRKVNKHHSFTHAEKKITRVQIEKDSELNGYLDTLFLFLEK